ncbi:MAG: SIMPL domain-containing protein [bacterium]|nr:SIMPL domain-containing protein [bacterium]
MNKFEILEKFQITLLAIIIAVAIIFTAKVITSSVTHDGVTVTGSAYEIVKSDSGKLSFNISVQAKTKAQAHQIMKKQLAEVQKYLLSKGIKDVEIKNYNGYDVHKYNSVTGNYTNEVEFYRLSQPIEALSENVNLIKSLSLDIQNLINNGIDINETRTNYSYSGLAELKVKLLSLATKDAKNRAEAMLKANHNRVGKIQSINMGVFQITAVDSTDVSDMGINDTTTIDKKVTAVANVVFKIK